MVKIKGFERENNEGIRNGEKISCIGSNLSLFLFSIWGAMTRISSRITSLWRQFQNLVLLLKIGAIYVISLSRSQKYL